ncbi:hypothetical protein ABBQ38_010327 [Trebouxia sp. C0009 RCD-2024]
MVASWLDTTHQDDAGISWTSGSTGQLVSKICSWCLIDSSGTVEHPHSLRLTESHVPVASRTQEQIWTPGKSFAVPGFEPGLPDVFDYLQSLEC